MCKQWTNFLAYNPYSEKFWEVDIPNNIILDLSAMLKKTALLILWLNAYWGVACFGGMVVVLHSLLTLKRALELPTSNQMGRIWSEGYTTTCFFKALYALENELQPLSLGSGGSSQPESRASSSIFWGGCTENLKKIIKIFYIHFLRFYVPDKRFREGEGGVKTPKHPTYTALPSRYCYAPWTTVNKTAMSQFRWDGFGEKRMRQGRVG